MRTTSPASRTSGWRSGKRPSRTRPTTPSDSRPRKYILDMFPYPSGDLHMGHAEAFAYGDIVARYWRIQGFNVLHPIGWDSFGLPAENAAIKRGIDPRGWTYDNIAQQKASFKRYGNSFDWSRELHTSDPEYYKWNQWLFLKLYEKGLAYRKDSWVNWDPVDQTVLANEQVLPDGTSERSGAVVVKKKLTQWYFKITDYADRLLDDLNQLEGSWPSKVLAMQRNWIGRSTGRRRRLRDRGAPGCRDGLHHAPRHPVRDDLHGRRARLRPGCGPGRRFVARGAEGLRRVSEAGAEVDGDRASGCRAREDRDPPRPLGDQPDQRGAHPGLDRGLRAGRLRPRGRDGRARPRSARPRLRDQVRLRRARRRRHERARDGRAADHHARDARSPAEVAARSTRSRPARRSTARAA